MLSLYLGAVALGLAFPIASGLLAPLLSERRPDSRRRELPIASPAVAAAFLCGAGGSGSLIPVTRDLPALVTAGTALVAGLVVSLLVVALTRGLFPSSGPDDADVDG